MIEEIEDRVLLLALLKREAGERCIDVLHTLVASRLFSLKEGKRRLKRLKREGFVAGEELTLLGVEAAKRAQEEFRL